MTTENPGHNPERRFWDQALMMKARWVDYGNQLTALLARPTSPFSHEERLNITALKWMGDHAAKAEVFWVAADMVDLLSVAADKMPQQALRGTDLPAPHGVVMFAEPIAAIQGFLWSTFHDKGVLLHTWAGDEPVGDRLGAAYLWRFGFTPREVGGEIADMRSDRERELDPDRFDLLNRYISTFWTLSQQRLAMPRLERASRTARRRAERIGAEPSEIRVVQLRRYSTKTEAAEVLDVDWSHRWIVSGHWRNQWLPSVKAHRLQWIAPYVKGPEDKPLVVKETVNAWVR